MPLKIKITLPIPGPEEGEEKYDFIEQLEDLANLSPRLNRFFAMKYHPYAHTYNTTGDPEDDDPGSDFSYGLTMIITNNPPDKIPVSCLAFSPSQRAFVLNGDGIMGYTPILFDFSAVMNPQQADILGTMLYKILALDKDTTGEDTEGIDRAIQEIAKIDGKASSRKAAKGPSYDDKVPPIVWAWMEQIEGESTGVESVFGSATGTDSEDVSDLVSDALGELPNLHEALEELFNPGPDDPDEDDPVPVDILGFDEVLGSVFMALQKEVISTVPESPEAFGDFMNTCVRGVVDLPSDQSVTLSDGMFDRGLIQDMGVSFVQSVRAMAGNIVRKRGGDVDYVIDKYLLSAGLRELPNGDPDPNNQDVLGDEYPGYAAQIALRAACWSLKDRTDKVLRRAGGGSQAIQIRDSATITDPWEIAALNFAACAEALESSTMSVLSHEDYLATGVTQSIKEAQEAAITEMRESESDASNEHLSKFIGNVFNTDKEPSVFVDIYDSNAIKNNAFSAVWGKRLATVTNPLAHTFTKKLMNRIKLLDKAEMRIREVLKPYLS